MSLCSDVNYVTEADAPEAPMLPHYFLVCYILTIPMDTFVHVSMCMFYPYT